MPTETSRPLPTRTSRPLQPVVVHERDCPLESFGEATRDRVEWRTLFSADRTPTRALTLGVADLPPAARDTLITHRHDPIEAYYVLAGEGLVSIDGVDHAVRAGSAVFLPGGCEHAALNTGSTVMRLLYVFASDSFDDVEYRFSAPGSPA